jgi:hypothetical protein
VIGFTLVLAASGYRLHGTRCRHTIQLKATGGIHGGFLYFLVQARKIASLHFLARSIRRNALRLCVRDRQPYLVGQMARHRPKRRWNAQIRKYESLLSGKSLKFLAKAFAIIMLLGIFI